MNYSPEAIDRLAASYALGTLRGRARARFEALSEASAAVGAAREGWEQRLADLALRVRPVQPAAGTWRAILQEIGLQQIGGPPDTSASVLAFPARKPQRPFWQQLAVAASLALLAGSLGWFAAQQRGVPTSSPPVMQAVLSDPSGRPLWRVAVNADLRRMQVTMLAAESVADDRSLELWALPRNGGTPVSLGLLPRSRALSVALLEPQRAALQSADKIAVTLEPRGGSRIAGPTGPVLHVADLTRS